MGKKHPHLSRERLHRLGRGKGEWAEFLGRLLEHVEALCPVCAAELAAYVEEKQAESLDRCFGPRRSLRSTGFLDGLQVAEEQAQVLRGNARRDLAELLSLPASQRTAKVHRALSRFRSAQLVELLLEECRQKVSADPREAYELAHLGLEVVLRLPAERNDGNNPLGLLALVQAAKANALRVEGDLPRSDELMEVAWSTAAHSRDPRVRAELAHLKASLRKDQRRFPEAMELLAEAHGLYECLGARERVGKVLLIEAEVLCCSGDVEGALGPLREASELFEETGDQLGLLSARHNLALYLATLGRYADARKILSKIGELYETHPEYRVRRDWLEGRIALGEGRLTEAGSLLHRARRAFARGERGYYVALVSLDLALVYLEEGRGTEIQALADEIIPLFEALQVNREAIAAILLFRKAAAQEELTVDIVRSIATQLERLHANPARRFERPS